MRCGANATSTRAHQGEPACWAASASMTRGLTNPNICMLCAKPLSPSLSLSVYIGFSWWWTPWWGYCYWPRNVISRLCDIMKACLCSKSKTFSKVELDLSILSSSQHHLLLLAKLSEGNFVYVGFESCNVIFWIRRKFKKSKKQTNIVFGELWCFENLNGQKGGGLFGWAPELTPPSC